MSLYVSGRDTDFLEVNLLVQRNKDFKLWQDSAVKPNEAITIHTTNRAESVDGRAYVLYSDGGSFPYRECIPFQRAIEAEEKPNTLPPSYFLAPISVAITSSSSESPGVYETNCLHQMPKDFPASCCCQSHPVQAEE